MTSTNTESKPPTTAKRDPGALGKSEGENSPEGTRAQLADAVVLDAHAHLNPDEEIMPVDSEDEDAKSIEVTSESEDESEDEMLTPSPR